MAIDYHFLYGFSDNILPVLWDNLLNKGGKNKEERLAAFLEEDADIVRKRNELVEKRKKLKRLQDELR